MRQSPRHKGAMAFGRERSPIRGAVNSNARKGSSVRWIMIHLDAEHEMRLAAIKENLRAESGLPMHVDLDDSEAIRLLIWGHYRALLEDDGGEDEPRNIESH